MIRDWQRYVESNINIKDRLGVRPFVKNDDTLRFVENAVELVYTVFNDLAMEFPEGFNILDFGCGSGRLPIGLDYMDFEINSYTGIDVMPSSIDFLSKAFESSDKHEFIHNSSSNARYANKQAGSLPEIPVKDYNLVVGWSVFTHLGHPDNAETYLKWLVSNVSKDCVFYLTWFKFPPNRLNYSEAMSVYSENTILELYKSVGLKIVGEFGGDTASRDNQWRIVAVKG